MDTSLSFPAVSATRRSVRVTGTALLIAFLAFLPQPFLVFLLPVSDVFIAPADLGSVWWRATTQSFVWGVIASALLVAVIAAGRCLRPSIWASVGTAAGVVGAAAWGAEAAMRSAAHAPFAAILSQAPAGEDVQATVLYLMNVVVGGFTILGFIGISVWMVMLGTAGAALIGRVCGVIAAIAGAGVALSTLAIQENPAGFLILLLFGVLGVVMLVRTEAALLASFPPDSDPGHDGT